MTASLTFEMINLPKSQYSIEITKTPSAIEILQVKVEFMTIILASIFNLMSTLLDNPRPILYITWFIDCYHIQLKYYTFELVVDLTYKLLFT